jgi:D-alanine-D-alanine ligase
MSQKKPVLIMFGGVSAEHEVSVISGLQIVDTIDRTLYESHAVFITKNGQMLYIPGLTSGKNFLKAKRIPVSFGADNKGGYITTAGVLSKKVYPYAAYLAFHGGTGEAGGVQGMLETLGIPQTSTTQESAAIVMNKQLTKTVLAEAGITTVPGISVFSDEITKDAEVVAERIIAELSLPVIIKPVHLGSSIGISIARTDVALHKYLLEAAHVDSEILVEKLLTDFTELNCALRQVNGVLETAPVERPVQHDELLSFADKYERGGKNKAAGSMAFMDRDLPAKIPDALRDRVQETAKKALRACRMQGSPRIDFMYTKHDDTLYLTEINPIPGSVGFYLWEAAGISFQQQITDSVEQAVLDASVAKTQRLDYETDIVEKFIKGWYQ